MDQVPPPGAPEAGGPGRVARRSRFLTSHRAASARRRNAATTVPSIVRRQQGEKLARHPLVVVQREVAVLSKVRLASRGIARLGLDGVQVLFRFATAAASSSKQVAVSSQPRHGSVMLWP